MSHIRNILLICIFFFGVSTAQQKDRDLADSLEKVASMTKDDTNKVNLFNELSSINYNLNPEKGIKYGEEALSISEKLDWALDIALIEETVKKCPSGAVTFYYNKKE